MKKPGLQKMKIDRKPEIVIKGSEKKESLRLSFDFLADKKEPHSYS